MPWEAHAALPWVQAMAGCPQDPIYHAEGDVFIHTRMVLEALAADPLWRQLPERDRRVTYLAALLHDVAKPFTTTQGDDGRVHARGHSKAGAIMTRRLLWELGLPFAEREAVAALVAWHQHPYFLIEDERAEARLSRISQTARCDLLVRLSTADITGRVCEDPQRALDNIALFELFAEEHGCLREPAAFHSDHARVAFFRGRLTARDVPLFDDTRFEVALLCGLPGAGKDRWLATHHPELPVVSLDDTRAALGVDHGQAEGQVRQAALESARVHLRAGRPFAWNATNLFRQRRAPLIELCERYGARVRVVYVEASAERLWTQNRARDSAVPEAVVRGMMRGWEVPDLTEAHAVEWVVDGAGA